MTDNLPENIRRIHEGYGVASTTREENLRKSREALRRFATQRPERFVNAEKAARLLTRERCPSNELLDELATIIDPKCLTAWLDTPHDFLDGMTPRAYVGSNGEQRIWDMVGWLKEGVM